MQVGYSKASPAVAKRGVLVWIALYKIAKAILTLAAGIATLRLRHHDLTEMTVHLVHRLNIAPDSHLAAWLFGRVLHVDDRQLGLLSIGFFIYSSLYFVEGIGLYFDKTWAEWLIVVSSCLLLPLEVYELFHRPNWLKVVLLVANLAVIAYLIWRIDRDKRESLRACAGGAGELKDKEPRRSEDAKRRREEKRSPPLPNPRDILIAVLGSHGDVHPFIGIGMGLRERGHRVRVIVNPHFESIVRGAGLEILPLGTDEEYRALASHPDLWHPLRGPRYVFEQMGALVPATYQAIAEHQVPGKTLLVHSSLAMGARVAQEKLGIPTATIHLQPAVIRSAILPPLLPGAPIRSWMPLPLRRMVMWLADRLILDPIIAPQLNRFRATLGLPPVRRILHGWWNSPQRAIGLFPDWYAPPQRDWPPQLKLTGFPLYDERGLSSLSPELDEFLRQGTPPIAFTPGSAMWKADDFFQQGAAACAILGRRGLLLSRHADHIPRDLPKGVIHVPYAPFSELLPRCAALVHHGGIGTTAQAMASGVSQIIMPFSHDQPDNAERVNGLGIAQTILPDQFTADRVARVFSEMMDDASVRESCRAVAKRFERNDAIVRTCELIEQLAK